MRQPLTVIGSTLLACTLWTAPARAETSTQVGNAGTITLDWQVTQDKAGRPLIVGHVITVGGKASYCIPRLLVQTLDAQGQVTAERMGFIPGSIGGYDKVYFEEPSALPDQPIV
jgi:hypothetical protein